jgi:hypothetical protein
MSKGLRISLIVVGVAVVAAALVLAGLALARTAWGVAGDWPGGMMGYYPSDLARGGAYLGRGGMMGGGMMGAGAYGTGMMSGGMMAGTSLYGLEPLTLAEAEEALDDYLAALGKEDLRLGEVMIFDNHAYAQIVEADTGIGALEVLVDPLTRAVYPEHGPNMMWNLKYSPMAGSIGFGMMGGRMGRLGFYGAAAPEPTADLPISAEQAVAAARSYLGRYLPGATADEHADPFYGYYTLHILRDGKIVGMLSVNGYTAQVFVHSWHGDFVEATAVE